MPKHETCYIKHTSSVRYNLNTFKGTEISSYKTVTDSIYFDAEYRIIFRDTPKNVV